MAREMEWMLLPIIRWGDPKEWGGGKKCYLCFFYTDNYTENSEL